MFIVELKKKQQQELQQQVQDLQQQIQVLIKRLDYLNFKQSVFVESQPLYNVVIDVDFVKSAEYQEGDFIGYGTSKKGNRIYFTKNDVVKLYQTK